MSKQFSVAHQFELYLKRVKLSADELSTVQHQETRRAFYGAWGQILMLMDSKSGKLALTSEKLVYDKMILEVMKFWEAEIDRTKYDNDGATVEIKIKIQDRGTGKLKISTEYPAHANAGLVCGQLSDLGRIILTKIQEKAASQLFDTKDEARAYVNSLTIGDLA